MRKFLLLDYIKVANDSCRNKKGDLNPSPPPAAPLVKITPEVPSIRTQEQDKVLLLHLWEVYSEEVSKLLRNVFLH